MNDKQISEYISELERKVQDLEKTVEDYGNRIADASFTLYDWDGYYDFENLNGNADELALLAEDVYSILQGKPWLETPLRERLEKRGEKSDDVEGQMVFDYTPMSLDPNLKLPPIVEGILVGDNDHGDAVPPPPPTPEDIMMRNQELTMQNIDLNARAIKAEAMCKTLRAEVAALKDERDEARREACMRLSRYQDERDYPFGIPNEQTILCNAMRFAEEFGWNCFKEVQP